MVWSHRDYKVTASASDLFSRIEKRVRREVRWMSCVASCVVTFMVAVHVAIITYALP